MFLEVVVGQNRGEGPQKLILYRKVNMGSIFWDQGRIEPAANLIPTKNTYSQGADH